MYLRFMIYFGLLTFNLLLIFSVLIIYCDVEVSFQVTIMLFAFMMISSFVLFFLSFSKLIFKKIDLSIFLRCMAIITLTTISTITYFIISLNNVRI